LDLTDLRFLMDGMEQSGEVPRSLTLIQLAQEMPSVMRAAYAKRHRKRAAEMRKLFLELPSYINEEPETAPAVEAWVQELLAQPWPSKRSSVPAPLTG
jgi:hypothetical protein